MAESISPDYLVIGAGAMGMAFIDTLLSENPKATIALVDRYARPGGHWTIAYPFVRLHQPSAFYGVDSRPLGDNKIDQVGWNKGLFELATGNEVCAYFDKVLNQTFLPSGRVEYYPKHEYLGHGRFRSIITEKEVQVGENTCIVDATYMKVEVPAMRPPKYEVADGVPLVTPNDLPNIRRPHSNYTVVGAGKTGIDACLWLLANGIDPKSITWIMPRDSWYMERGRLQPKSQSIKEGINPENAFTAIVEATSAKDVLLREEASKAYTRLDENVWPTMFRCATISLAELEQIRKIGAVIRKGRVVKIGKDEVKMEQGSYTPNPDSLYIDCTADGLAKLPPVPVFQGRNITLQSVRYCQQVFSAALIAHVEAVYPSSDEDLKNSITTVVPHPDETLDFLTVSLTTFKNEMAWVGQPQTREWLAKSRLNWIGNLLAPPPGEGVDVQAYYAKLQGEIRGLCGKLEELLGREDAKEANVAA